MSKKRKPKVKPVKTTENSEYPAISFRHLTTNNRYGIKQILESDALKISFFDACHRMMKTSYKELFALSNKNGLESIEFYRMNFSPGMLDIPKDKKVYVFRFDGDSKRIIGHKEKEVLHIIGFDYDFTAYAH